jgi:hypothetical protein
MDKGMFVLPLENELIKTADDGNKKPKPTPNNMARKIHSVK